MTTDNKFKIGQKVRVNEGARWGAYNSPVRRESIGEIALVVSEEDLDNDYLLTFKDGSDGYVGAEFLTLVKRGEEKVEATDTPTVGDRVRIVGGPKGWVGLVGEVVSVLPGERVDFPVRVMFDGSSDRIRRGFNFDEVKIIAPERTDNFSVGDRVRVLRTLGAGLNPVPDSWVGQEGTVQYIRDGHQYSLGVMMDSVYLGRRFHFKPSEVEKIEPEPEPVLPVTVTITLTISGSDVKVEVN